MKSLKRRANKLIPAFSANLARQYAFWLCFFALTRLIFLLYNREELHGIPLSETSKAFTRALYVDLSMAAYFMLVPLILTGISAFYPKTWLSFLNNGFQKSLIVLVSLITIAELPIYDEWGHKLTYKALWFLQHPAEVYHTASLKQFWGGLLATGIIAFAGFRMFRLFTSNNTDQSLLKPQVKLFSLIIWLAFTLTAIRGGYKPIPIQISDAYYSRHNILNAASANSSFHLISNVLQNLEAKKPYRFMDSAKAANLINQLYKTEKDTTVLFLSAEKPNVILIVLEGWAADVVSSMGGLEGIAPHFSRMASMGISFDSCYASGNLSDQGMGAVFSAFPAQPRTSIITLPDKYVKLPCINTAFLNAGYHTSFLFGGQLSYGNIRSYMYYNRFHQILEESDFNTSIYRGRLGVHDGDVLERQLAELNSASTPFFASLFTLSTHGPYDFPGGRPLKWGDKESDYINSVHYADSCLNQFMIKARKQPWFNQTLFVFVSDHHHNTPKGYSYFHPEYRRIPLVFYGEVIKPEFRGYKDKVVCSQLDLATTLLRQLRMTSPHFPWSNNLFNPYSKRFAFYTFDEGFGWIRPEGRLVWFADNRIEAGKYANPEDKARLLEEGKAYLQRVTEQFREGE